MALSDRQQSMLDFIREFTHEHGYPPSIREIGKKVGITSTSVVNYNLNILEREGLIGRDRRVSRGVKMPQTAKDGGNGLNSLNVFSIPLYGTIAAGQPLPRPDTSLTPDETIELTREIVRDPSNVYALRVKGQSMIDALINDGDIVIMRHQDDADNGDMVAVWLKDEGETTLKRLYREGERVRLQPANPTMKPIYVDARNVQVKGKVVAVVRKVA